MRESAERLDTRRMRDCVGVIGDQIIDCVFSERGDAMGVSASSGESLAVAMPGGGGDDVFRDVENEGDNDPDGMQMSIAGADVLSLPGLCRISFSLSRPASMPRCVSTA